MQENVRITVPQQPQGMRNFHAADDEFAAFDEAVAVVTEAGTDIGNHGVVLMMTVDRSCQVSVGGAREF